MRKKGTAYFLGFTVALNEGGTEIELFFLWHSMNPMPYYLFQYIQPSWTNQCCKHGKCDFMPCELFWNSSLSVTPPFLPHPPKSVQSGMCTWAKQLNASGCKVLKKNSVPAEKAGFCKICSFLISLPYHNNQKWNWAMVHSRTDGSAGFNFRYFTRS